MSLKITGEVLTKISKKTGNAYTVYSLQIFSSDGKDSYQTDVFVPEKDRSIISWFQKSFGKEVSK